MSGRSTRVCAPEESVRRRLSSGHLANEPIQVVVRYEDLICCSCSFQVNNRNWMWKSVQGLPPLQRLSTAKVYIIL